MYFVEVLEILLEPLLGIDTMFFSREKRKATRDSWDNQPLSEKTILLPYNKSFNAQEYELLSYGFIPDSMEDKWFIYLENDVIYFHRSWTGICVFQIYLEKTFDGCQIKEAWVTSGNNSFNENYLRHENFIKENIDLLNRLIDVFLLLKR